MPEQWARKQSLRGASKGNKMGVLKWHDQGLGPEIHSLYFTKVKNKNTKENHGWYGYKLWYAFVY